MDRLPEHLVAWHNRHPLAKRITIDDVHTVGVVALPFMRSGRQAAAGESVEPIEPVWGGESTLAQPNTKPAQRAALADQEPRPPTAAAAPSPPRWQFWRSAGVKSWPVFSERFIEGLSLRRIAAFAQAQGFTSRPNQPTWPLRDIGIDDRLIAKADTAEGAWPVEIYLISAAIDAGHTRSRVLIGRKGVSKRAPPVLGKRCLSPRRVGAAALSVLLLAGAVVLALWRPTVDAAVQDPVPMSATSAASAASAATALPSASMPEAAASNAASTPTVTPAASGASGASAASATLAAPALSASEPAAVAAAVAAAEPASSPADAAFALPPDIRPRLVQRNHLQRTREPTRAMLAPPEDKPAEKIAEKMADMPADKATPDAKPSRARTPPANADTAPTATVVALVGPPSANKAEAEAMLERLRTAVAGTQSKSRVMQGQVFQTPEGYRAAVWPFNSREEAQLINAVLVARGMKTRAVDF